MPDRPPTHDADPESSSERASLSSTPVTSAYKVLGELADPDGIGVLGQNNAASGTPIGVRGAVPNADGYGLYTDDDAWVGGTMVTAHPWQLLVGQERAIEVSGEGAGYGGSVVIGHSSNAVEADALAATISGGGFDSGTLIVPNVVFDDFGTVGGGRNNRAGSDDTDPTNARYATVSGGDGNTAEGPKATVGGGELNVARGYGSTVGGGSDNFNDGDRSTVGGGLENVVIGSDATIGGGWNNRVDAQFATVAGGGPTDTTDALTQDNTRNIVYDEYGTIGGGGNNQAGFDDADTATAPFATVGGGEGNAASGPHATVGGGDSNAADGDNSTIGGGQRNQASGSGAAVGGGSDNVASGIGVAVPGGVDNTADGDYAVAAGRLADANGHAGAFVVGDSTPGAVQAQRDDEVRLQAGGGLVVENGPVDIGRVGVSAYLSSNQTVPDSTQTVVAFDALWNGVDDFGGFDTSTGVYTVGADGDYHADFMVFWDDPFDESVLVDHLLHVNGLVFGGGAARRVTPSIGPVTEGFSKTLFGLSAGDTISVAVSHQNGSGVDIRGGSVGRTYLTVHKVG